MGDLMSYQSSLGGTDADYIRFRFRITNDLVLEQLQLSGSKILEIELKRGEARWSDVESVRGPRSNQAKPEQISTAHLSRALLDKLMRLRMEAEDAPNPNHILQP